MNNTAPERAKGTATMHLKKRNVIAVIVLSYFTFGIYVVYWLYKTRLELVAQTGNKRDIPRVRTMYLPFVVTVAAAFAALILNSADSTTSGAQTSTTILVFVALGAVIFAMVRAVQFLLAYCRTVTRITEQRSNNSLFWTWIICDLIGVPVGQALAQNSINQFVERGGNAGTGNANSAGPSSTAQPFSPIQ